MIYYFITNFQFSLIKSIFTPGFVTASKFYALIKSINSRLKLIENSRARIQLLFKTNDGSADNFYFECTHVKWIHFARTFNLTSMQRQSIYKFIHIFHKAFFPSSYRINWFSQLGNISHNIGFYIEFLIGKSVRRIKLVSTFHCIQTDQSNCWIFYGKSEALNSSFGIRKRQKRSQNNLNRILYIFYSIETYYFQSNKWKCIFLNFTGHWVLLFFTRILLALILFSDLCIASSFFKCFVTYHENQCKCNFEKISKSSWFKTSLRIINSSITEIKYKFKQINFVNQSRISSMQLKIKWLIFEHSH